MKRSVLALLSLVPVMTVMAATPAEQMAEAAAVRYADSFESGRAADVYALLPASYQKDISKVVSTFGASMDADIWKEGQSVVATLADVVAAKADLVAAMIAEKSKVPVAEISPAVLKSANAVKALSGKITLDTLKKGDVVKILSYPEIVDAGAVSKIAAKEVQKGAVVGSKEAADGSVMISFKNEAGVIEEEPFVKVDNKWVPKEMADGWKEGVAEALKGIGEMKIEPAMKQQLLSMSPMIKAGIEGAKNATTKEQFQQSLMMPMFTAMMMMGSQGAPMAPASAK